MSHAPDQSTPQALRSELPQWLSAAQLSRSLPQDGQLAGMRVTVMGLGRFGGGLGVSQWLLDRGASVTITDLEPESRLLASVHALHAHPRGNTAKLVLGAHHEHDFTSCDLVVANVAVPKPWDNRFLAAACAKGVGITTEIALTVDRLRTHRRTIGITGTVGKSTTTAMVHDALSQCLANESAEPNPNSPREACGTTNPSKALLGGNIGGSLLPALSSLVAHDWVVLELSSAQLWWLSQLLRGERAWSPHIACLTTFADNHGDWHGGIAHYHASKAQLFAHQRANDTAVFGPGLLGPPPQGQGFTTQPGVLTREVTHQHFAHRMTLPGAHNVLNAALAHALVHAACPQHSEQSARTIASFRGLAHRLQLVAEVRGVRYYNDSKSTTPQATLTALHALQAAGNARIHLIAGGYDKHADLLPIAHAGPQLRGLWGIGATGNTIVSHASSLGATAHLSGTLEQAMREIVAQAKPGESVLLSPGCASWDQFENFEQRGELFVRLVQQASENTASC